MSRDALWQARPDAAAIAAGAAAGGARWLELQQQEAEQAEREKKADLVRRARAEIEGRGGGGAEAETAARPQLRAAQSMVVHRSAHPEDSVRSREGLGPQPEARPRERPGSAEAKRSALDAVGEAADEDDGPAAEAEGDAAAPNGSGLTWIDWCVDHLICCRADRLEQGCAACGCSQAVHPRGSPWL